MKVTLMHCYSDHNRGDTGIIYSIYDLAADINPSASIAGMSVFAGDDPRFRTDHKHTEKLVKKIYPSFFPEPGVWQGQKTESKLKKLAVFLKYAVSNLLIYMSKSHSLAKLLLSRQEYDSFNNFVTSDKVISKGGSFLYSFKGWEGVFFFLRMIYPFYLAKRFGVESYIYSQSLGPFENRTARIVFNLVQPHVTGIYLREHACKKYLKRVTDNIKVISDLAFSLRPGRTVTIDRSRRCLAITARPHRFQTERQRDLYIESLCTLINDASKTYNVYLVPQVTGPTASEDDREVLKLLYENAENKKNVFFPDEDFEPRALKALYGQMDFLVGTRLHSVIFALGMGVPSICISYHGTKAEGIMALLGLSDFVLDINTLHKDALLDKFVDLEKMSEELRCRVSEEIKVINNELYNSMKDIMA